MRKLDDDSYDPQSIAVSAYLPLTAMLGNVMAEDF